MGINTKWLRDVTQEEREERRKFVLAHAPVLQQLKKILQVELEAVETKQESPSGYSSPAWAAQQADYLATRRTLKEIIALITFDQKE